MALSYTRLDLEIGFAELRGMFLVEPKLFDPGQVLILTKPYFKINVDNFYYGEH